MLKFSFITLMAILAILFACKTIKIEDSSAVASSNLHSKVNVPARALKCSGTETKDSYTVQFYPENQGRVMVAIHTRKDGTQMEYVGAYSTIAQFLDDSSQVITMQAGHWLFELSNFSSSSKNPEFVASFHKDGPKTLEHYSCQ